MSAKFTAKAQRALNRALTFAREMGHTYIGTEHLLLGLLSESDSIASNVLEGRGITEASMKELVKKAAGTGDATNIQPSDMTPRTKKVIEDAARESLKSKSGYIGTEHLLSAIISEPGCFAYKMISAQGISASVLKSDLLPFYGTENSKGKEKSRPFKIEGAPILSKYGKDLVASAASGEVDPVIGRKRETERLMQILTRRTKNNACLIGEPGVGKTAVVEGLATRIAEGRAPEGLRDRVIVTLDIPSMIAGAKYRGEFEERLKGVMEEVAKNKRIILFIDEVHTIIGAGAAEGAVDAANIIKPALARGEMQVIGATTIDEYRRHIEKDAALERRFQSVTVEEPSPEETLDILRGLRDRYEAHHRLKITDEALASAVKLSVRFIKDRYLPDKAIDLIDEASSKKRIELSAKPGEITRIKERILTAGAEKEEAILSEDYETAAVIRDMEKDLICEYRERKAKDDLDRCKRWEQVTSEDIARIVTEWTDIPVTSLSEKEEDGLFRLEEKLLERVIGQDEAVSVVSRAVKRGRVGLKDPQRPIATFLFLGPTGVGKTHLTKTLASAVFGGKERLIRFDMSEFGEKHSVSKLIGSPPGYVGYDDGGSLTEAVRREPYSIILFDEAEKAHPAVLNLLLQLMDEGRLTDSRGRECDFKNTVVVLTSNAGASDGRDRRHAGFSENNTEKERKAAKEEMRSRLKGTFSPELLNRIDETVVFRRLDEEDIEKISGIFLGDVSTRLRERGIELIFAPDTGKKLAKAAFDRANGARALKRLVVRKIEDSVTDGILSGKIKKGDRVKCALDTDLNASYSVASEKALGG